MAHYKQHIRHYSKVHDAAEEKPAKTKQESKKSVKPAKTEPAQKNSEGTPKEKPQIASSWSEWMPVHGSNWQVFWCGRQKEDGTWVYQFTKDFKTIWDQNQVTYSAPPQTTSGQGTQPSSSPGEMLGETAPSPLPEQSVDVVDGNKRTSSFALAHDLSTLTLKGNSGQEESLAYSAYSATAAKESYGSSNAQEASTAGVSQRYQLAVETEEAEASATSQVEGRRTHKSHRFRSSKKAVRHSKNVGDVVRAEKDLRIKAQSKVDNWYLEWEEPSSTY